VTTHYTAPKNTCVCLVASGASSWPSSTLRRPLGPSVLKRWEKRTSVWIFPITILFVSRLLHSYIIFLDKEKGHRMTLQDFLDKYHDDKNLKAEYEQCNKGTLIDDFKVAKQAKASIPMRVSNISITKAVYAKVGNITASVRSYYLLEHISYPSLVPGTQSNIRDSDRPPIWSWQCFSHL